VSEIYRVLGKSLVRRILRALDKEAPLDIDRLSRLLGKEVEATRSFMDDLERLGLVSRSPYRLVYYLTSRGKSCLVLGAVIQGDEGIEQAMQKLSPYLPREFELLTRNVADTFLETALKGRIFQNLCVCSPWIQIEGRNRERFEKVIADSRESLGDSVKVLVITRPPDLDTDFGKKIGDTLLWLKNLGGDVSTVKKLHTKLYIAEPGPHGGTFFAVFGSENLTGASNLELGIKITNNTDLLRRLVAYFFSIFSAGKPY